MKKFSLALALLAILFLSFSPLLYSSPQEEHGAATEEHAEGAHEETIWQTIGKWFNFFALVAILYLFLKKTLRVQDKFKSDSEEIQRSIESARQAKEEAELRLKELDDRMVEMNQEVERIKRDASVAAEEEKRRILESAQREAERIVEFAHREVENEIRIAKKELRKHTAELAIAQGKNIIQEEINDQDHKRLIQDYIEGFGK